MSKHAYRDHRSVLGVMLVAFAAACDAAPEGGGTSNVGSLAKAGASDPDRHDEKTSAPSKTSGVRGDATSAKTLPSPTSTGSSDDPPGGATTCLFPTDGASTTSPLATIEQTIEVLDGVRALHVRLTFSRSFVDNTYGTSSVGWGSKGHTFRNLVGSDHAELAFVDAQGVERLRFKQDYISAAEWSASGYASLGVKGGDGKMLVGDAAAVLKTTSSLDRNLNERGYAHYTEDSPPTDAAYAPPAAAANWDFDVVYESWIDLAALGTGGASAELESVHASPSKLASNTIPVGPGTCPPDTSPPPPPPKTY